MRVFFYFLICGVLTLFSCDGNRVYETNMDIADGKWSEKNKLTFEFDIPDEKIQYNLYYNIRYGKDYSFYNLYVKYHLKDSTGKVLTDKLQGMDLFKPTTGKPYGDGLGDVFDHRVLAIPAYRFPYKGKYKFEVEQYMRQDPLPGISAFGLRVEKAVTE